MGGLRWHQPRPWKLPLKVLKWLWKRLSRLTLPQRLPSCTRTPGIGLTAKMSNPGLLELSTPLRDAASWSTPGAGARRRPRGGGGRGQERKGCRAAACVAANLGAGFRTSLPTLRHASHVAHPRDSRAGRLSRSLSRPCAAQPRVAPGGRARPCGSAGGSCGGQRAPLKGGRGGQGCL